MLHVTLKSFNFNFTSFVFSLIIFCATGWVDGIRMSWRFIVLMKEGKQQKSQMKFQLILERSHSLAHIYIYWNLFDKRKKWLNCLMVCNLNWFISFLSITQTILIIIPRAINLTHASFLSWFLVAFDEFWWQTSSHNPIII